MYIKTIVLCTADKRYAELFAEAVNLFSEDTMRIIVLLNAENLEEVMSAKESPDLILMETQMYQDFCRKDKGTGSETLRQMIKSRDTVFKSRICLLTEDAEEKHSDWIPADIPKIYKYRDMEAILTDIRGILEKQNMVKKADEKDMKQFMDDSNCKLIGFYSPVRRTGQSTYAKRLAAKAGENIPVLYISLDSYDGDSQIERDTLADLLYYIQQEDMVFQRVVQKVVWQEENFHQIHPMPFPLDLWNTGKEQWKELFRILKEKSIYKKIFLDFGDARIDGLFDLLEMCDIIYTPIEDDAAALHKLTQYERTLAVLGKQEIIEKTRRVYLRSHGEKTELERAII